MTSSCSSRLDYSTLHRTGERVQKPYSADSAATMSEVTRLKLEERRHRTDISEAIELNEVEDFDDISRLNAHVDNLLELLRKFRDIHFRLEESIGSVEYQKDFSDRESIAQTITDEVKKCKQFKVSLKAPASVKVGSSDQLKIRDDIELCICKVDSILTNFPVQALSSVEDIRLNVSKVAENIAT